MKKNIELTVRMAAEVEVDPSLDVDDSLYVEFPKGPIKIMQLFHHGPSPKYVGEAYEHETVHVEEIES